ncbi:hypothetical protein D3C81_1484750 [compost metagenome]
MASPRTQAGRGMSRCSSTASLRRRASSSCRARSTTCARSRRSRRPPGLLRAKVFRWPVSAAMRSSCSSRRCSTPAACSSRPCSRSRRRVASCMRWAVSGWLISCASAADICPSAASLAACTSPSCAVRRAAVRSSTSRSSSSRLRWRRRARRQRWCRNRPRKTSASQAPAAPRATPRPAWIASRGWRSRCRVQPSEGSGRLCQR